MSKLKRRDGEAYKDHTLSTCYVSGSLVGTVDPGVNETGKASTFTKEPFLGLVRMDQYYTRQVAARTREGIKGAGGPQGDKKVAARVLE